MSATRTILEHALRAAELGDIEERLSELEAIADNRNWKEQIFSGFLLRESFAAPSRGTFAEDSGKDLQEFVPAEFGRR